MVLFPQLFGPVGLFSGLFLSPEKLLFLLAFLVPLVLLYLIRPKPQNVAVPSLMFILRDMGRSNVHRLFRTLLKDILFLIQLFAILFLALALAKPFIETDQKSLVNEAVLIIDVSASTRAFDDARFKKIQDLAEESLSRENVIILSHLNPRVLERSGEPRLTAGEAKDFIGDLEPTDMPGDLPTALDMAAEYIGPSSKVTIVSDFVLSNFEHPDLIESRIKVLRSKGALIEVKQVGEPGENIGIIDAKLNTENATLDLKIQNFNDGPEEFGLEYNGEPLSLPKNLLEPKGKSGSLLSISIALGNGVSKILLTPKDDLMSDNTYYVSIPEQENIKVLIISNDQNVENSKLIPALEAAGDQFTKVLVSYGKPPKVPDLEHNVYIVKDIDTQFILPGAVKGMREKVEEGAVFVIFSQPGLFAVDYLDLLPVKHNTQAEPLIGRQEIVVNSTLALVRGLSDIGGQVDGNQLLRVEPTENSLVYASVATADGMEPVIAAKRLGKGAVIYYGIKDRVQFDIDPQSYAILWGRIIDFSLTDPMDLNVQTGAVLTTKSGKVKTPMGKRSPPVLAEQSGLYQTSDATLAANLYPLHPAFGTSETTNVRLESDISERVDISLEDVTGAADGEEDEVKVPRDLSIHFIIAGLVLLLFELFFIKYRGDL